MDKSNKTVFFMFSLLEYKTMEEYFEKMASEGWMFESVKGVRAKFKKMEPRNVKFAVDLFPIKMYAEAEENRELSEYIDTCEQSGWTLLTSINSLQIFYSNDDERPLPIQTDSEIEEKIVRKVIMSPQGWSTFILMVWIWFMSYSNFTNFSYEKLFSNVMLGSYIYFSIMAFVFFVYIAFYLVWFIKARNNVKNRKPLPKVPLKISLIRCKFTLFIVVFSVLILILATIFDVFSGQSVLLFFLIPLFAFEILIILFFKKIYKYKKTYKKVFIVSLIFSLFFMVGIIISISFVGVMSAKESTLPDKYVALTLSDFNKGAKTEHFNFYKSSSILVPENFTYWEVGNKSSVHTEYMRSINEYISSFIFNQILNEYSEKFEEIIKIDYSEQLGADVVYQVKPDRNKYLILRGNEIFRIEFDPNITEDIFINVFNEKLMSNRFFILYNIRN